MVVVVPLSADERIPTLLPFQTNYFGELVGTADMPVL
jgi:hypothetical protein